MSKENSTSEPDRADSSLATEIAATRRRLLSGLAFGAGAASTGLLDGSVRATDEESSDPSYYLDWTLQYVSDHPPSKTEPIRVPKTEISTRDELAAANHDTTYQALSPDQQTEIDEAFHDQFSSESQPRPVRIDVSKLQAGMAGSVEFDAHVLDESLHLWLTASKHGDVDWEFLKRVDATVRYRDCPDDDDAVIVDGSLAVVVQKLVDGVPIDGNRSHGARESFDAESSHGFVLEWEVDNHVHPPAEAGAFSLDFYARPDDEHERKKSQKRKYTVHAIDVEITYNSFGTHNPRGAMYVLEENLDAVREAEGVLPGRTDVDTSVIEPLVLRANEGDVVEIEFVNSLGRHPEREFPERPASIHPTGIAYEVDESDGLEVGFNENTIVESGESITYTWHADAQGAHFFHDGAYQAWDSIPDGDPEEVNSMARGLFGALIVEPPGATWTDPCSGAPLRSGTRADIHLPEFPDHREFVPIYHDHGVFRPDGLNVPGTDFEQSLHAINYRAERTSERVGETGFGDEAFYSSWVHGDPGGGDTVFEAYQGDPVKMVPVGANPEENHVHHLHEHRWKNVPTRLDSDTIDSQTLAMGNAFEQFLTVASGPRSIRDDFEALDFEEAFAVGAGGFHGGIGDLLFHCHMFPHYGEGMNGILRVHNQRQVHLQPLPNNEPTLPLDSEILGFPDFIPAEEGELPPKPPLSQLDDPRQPTETERESLPALLPGAPYTDPCNVEGREARTPDPREESPEAVEPDLVYDIVAIDAELVYNDAGDFDPDGKVFVLEDHLDAVLDGEMMPEPLFIRANVGDCIELNVRNELEEGTSTHVHFVGFDQLGSDSATVGYNYDQGVDTGDTMTFRWFADEEGTIFFHDHITGISDIMNGEFGALIVEPEGSEWLDPHTGEPIRFGSQAIIDPPEEEAYREFCLCYHDFAPLIDGDRDLTEAPDNPEDDAFVNPDVQHGVNAGVGAINYRNSPYYRRGPDPDPAYVHSSFVHGDPETPTLETYPGDKVRIRLLQSAYEEQHNFGIHGVRADSFGIGPEETVSEIIGPSEAFTFEVREADSHDFEALNNAAGLPIRDYLYGSMVSFDLWDGMWGIHRVFDAKVDHLEPLPDRKPPGGKITEKQLKELGHPAPFDRRAERGHRAKLTFDQPTADPSRPPDEPRRRNEFIDGDPPPNPPSPGDPCPDAARTLEYDVSAIQTRIDFNEYGDHDPHGIVFALDDHVEDIKKGDRPADPLLLRANVNDCVEVTLTNALGERDAHDDHPRMRTPERDLPPQWEPSNRISLHPQRLIYDVNGSDGATVGFNYDQTVGPGESITYRWFAESETDTAALWDMADVRSNRHHGAFGQLLVEPEGSTWLDACTGEPTETAREAIIRPPDGEDFREFALSMSDARYVVNDELDSCVVPRNGNGEDDDEVDPGAPCNQLGDAEDQGYMGFNNRSEPFWRRFELNDDRQERVYDSEIHGDPATPVFRAHVDDPVRFRLSQPADASRGISWHLANHEWKRFPDVSESPIVGVDGRFTPGKSATVEPIDGAGGLTADAGDFIYKEMKDRRRLESGSWGIFRVDELPHERSGNTKKKPKGDEDDCPQPLAKHAKKIPLKDRPHWTVATGDFTNDGREDLLVGVPASDRGGYDAGAAYLFYGPVSREDVADLSTADAAILGDQKGRKAGTAVAVDTGELAVDTADGTRYVFHADELPHGETSLSDADRTVDTDS